MNKEEMLAIVRKQLTEQRYIHTLGVVETALELSPTIWSRSGSSRNWLPSFTIMLNFGTRRKLAQIIRGGGGYTQGLIRLSS